MNFSLSEAKLSFKMGGPCWLVLPPGGTARKTKAPPCTDNFQVKSRNYRLKKRNIFDNFPGCRWPNLSTKVALGTQWSSVTR